MTRVLRSNLEIRTSEKTVKIVHVNRAKISEKVRLTTGQSKTTEQTNQKQNGNDIAEKEKKQANSL